MSDLKSQAENYDLESLKNSLDRHDENIESLQVAIKHQEEFMDNERYMISDLQADKSLDQEHVRIDVGRLKDNIARHKEEIRVFKEEIEQEQARRRDTERLIMYKEMAVGS